MCPSCGSLQLAETQQAQFRQRDTKGFGRKTVVMQWEAGLWEGCPEIREGWEQQKKGYSGKGK